MKNRELDVGQDDFAGRVCAILRRALGLDEARVLNPDTALLGSMPELDSLTLVTLLTTLEKEFGFHIDDDEVDAALFVTVGSITDFVRMKLAQA